MKYKQGDIITIEPYDEHFELLWSLMDNYVRVSNCIDILKTKGIVNEFNNIRNDWQNAMEIIYPELKGQRYSIGSLNPDAELFTTSLKIIVTGINK